jgi:pimeloyl-ACP methyl ester carboxylesterase
VSTPDPAHLRELARSADRPPVILVPGLDGTALLFYRQIPLLAHAFDVVAFTLPDDPRSTMSGLVDDLNRLIGEVSGCGALLVGESFGGALAMSTALAHPESVQGLVIVNSFPWLGQRLRLRLAPAVLRALPWGAMPLVRRFTERRLHSSHALGEDLAEFRQRSRAIGREGYVRRLELLRRYDIRQRLGALAAPTLFLAADEDRLVPSVHWGRYMAARVPRSELVVLRGYGHVCLVNHDLDLLELIEPWWRAVGAGLEGPRGPRDVGPWDAPPPSS